MSISERKIATPHFDSQRMRVVHDPYANKIMLKNNFDSILLFWNHKLSKNVILKNTNHRIIQKHYSFIHYSS